MNASRTLLALLASTVALGSAAVAAPPGGIGVGVGVGSHGAAGVGAPPLGVPPVHVPPVNMPPVNVPKPQGIAVPPQNANANARAHANAQSNVVAGGVIHGTVTSVSGTNVTIALRNGTTQTYAVSAQTAARLQSFLNRTVAFNVRSGALSLIGQGTPPLRGTLTQVNGTTARVRLGNGTTQTYTVSAQQAAWLQAHVGKSVAFWTNANGTIELNQSSHASSGSHKHTAARRTRTSHSRGHIH